MDAIKSKAAYIIEMINQISGEKPGKKTLHKMVYLIEEKGVDLGYEYGLHFYGPYSAALNTETMFLSADGIVQFTYSGFSHTMNVNENIEIVPELSSLQKKTIKDVIEHFKDYSPSDLELLATTIYAYNNLDDRTEHSIIEGVKKIKGEKYAIDQISEAISTLSYFGKEIIPCKTAM
jgi:uncharacterized protein YwgA